MARFSPALERLRVLEGGWADHTADRGGRTKYGISQSAYPHLDIHTLTWEEAQKLYLLDYWQPLNLYHLESQAVATKMLSVAVHFGKVAGAKLLQQAYNGLHERGDTLVVDGKIGPRTLAAVNSVHPDSILGHLAREQLARYARIAAADPSQLVFLRGWVNRALAD